MRILVTGAAGFSGAYVAAYLARQGVDVVAGYRHMPPPLWLMQLPGVTLRRIDWLKPEVEFAVDGIVHAAATSPAPGISEERIARDSVDATRNVLDFAKRAGARRIVYLSSLSVYGHIERGRIDQDTPICNPDPYGAAKLAAEVLLREDIASGLGLTAGLSIRLPGIIGPGAARNWLATVIEKLRDGRDIGIYNPNAPFNNAVHVADIAALAARVLAADWTGYDVVTVGARDETTVRGAVERLAAGLGSPSAIVVEPSRRAAFTISSDRARERYGYDPMPINDMLDRFAAETLRP